MVNIQVVGPPILPNRHRRCEARHACSCNPTEDHAAGTGVADQARLDIPVVQCRAIVEQRTAVVVYPQRLLVAGSCCHHQAARKARRPPQPHPPLRPPTPARCRSPRRRRTRHRRCLRASGGRAARLITVESKGARRSTRHLSDARGGATPSATIDCRVPVSPRLPQLPDQSSTATTYVSPVRSAGHRFLDSDLFGGSGLR